MATTKTRTAGTCQICEREHKLHRDNVVHHGYQRPGDGEIHGDCFGAGQPPYEISCDALKTYQAWLVNQLVAAHEYLERLTSGQVSELYVEKQNVTTWQMGLVLINKSSPRWQHEMDRKIRQTQSKIRGLEQESQRVNARIADWKPAPIKTFEEFQAAERATKAAKAAEKAEKARIKAEAVAAKKARQEAREAARRAKIEALVADFRELAAQENPSREAAQKLVKRARDLDVWGARTLNLVVEAEKLGLVSETGYWK